MPLAISLGGKCSDDNGNESTVDCSRMESKERARVLEELVPATEART
jgi:hypothetical protein